MHPRASRTYQDPLHGGIRLDGSDPTEALLIRLIDTPPLQRLRRIRQLGPASLTFHGAESSRFTHSLGVMALARRAFDYLASAYPQLKPHRATVLCAALLHDIGHGPFSHTAEEVFGSRHEQWTRRIIQESDPIRLSLDRHSPDLRPSIEQVYLHQHPTPLVWQLVSSQLDCDRLDYLVRDSYFTGAAYGQIDLDRILMAMDYDPVSQQLVVAHKGLAAIEHYLTVRYFMYAQVYNHPKNLTASWGVTQAFIRARELLKEGRLDADETVIAWLTQDFDSLPLPRYLEGDDVVFMYHLHRWQTHPDPVLADLCRRFLNRDLLKILDVTEYNKSQQTQLLAKVRHQLQLVGLNPRFYCSLRHIWSRGYTLYQRGIKLMTSTGLQEISQLSSLVQTLIHPYQRTWLLFPAEIEEWIYSNLL